MRRTRPCSAGVAPEVQIACPVPIAKLVTGLIAEYDRLLQREHHLATEVSELRAALLSDGPAHVASDIDGGALSPASVEKESLPEASSSFVVSASCRKHLGKVGKDCTYTDCAALQPLTSKNARLMRAAASLVDDVPAGVCQRVVDDDEEFHAIDGTSHGSSWKRGLCADEFQSTEAFSTESYDARLYDSSPQPPAGGRSRCHGASAAAVVGSAGLPGRHDNECQQLELERLPYAELLVNKEHEAAQTTSDATCSEHEVVRTNSDATCSEQEFERAKSDATRSEGDLAREMPRLIPQASSLSIGTSLFVFELHDTWTKAADEAVDIPGMKRRLSLAEAIDRNRAGGVHGEELRSDSCMQRFVIAPDRVFVLAWQVLGMLMMSWDAVVLPMQPFELPGYELRESINNIIILFWLADMLLSFFIGYWNDTYMELRPGPVARAYVTGWFPMDLGVLMLDVVVFFTTTGTLDMFSIARSLKSVRLVRIARVFRLLRLAKVAGHFNSITDTLISEDLVTTLRITKMVLAVLALSHVIACAWYAIGDSFDEQTWVERLKWRAESLSADAPNWLYLYSTSLHWSLTQFTPGSMEVVPVNEIERIFTIAVILVALIICSSILSTITASMTHLRIMKTEQYQQQARMRQYLKQNAVSIRLSTSVQKFLRSHKKQGRTLLHEPDVKLLASLPASLRTLLRVEVRLPSLLPHPLFQKVSVECPSSTKELCDTGVEERSACKGDKVFTHRNPAAHMYFVRSGELKYEANHAGVTMLRGDDFVSEMALWVKWKHRGSLAATGRAELFAVDAEAFQDIIHRSAVHAPCCSYALQYVRFLQAGKGEHGVITDLSEFRHQLSRFVQVAWRGERNITRSGSNLDTFWGSWTF